MKIDKNGLSFKPVLCQEWKKVEFNLIYRSKKLNITIAQNIFKLKAADENDEILEFSVFEKKYTLKPGQEVKVKL